MVDKHPYVEPAIRTIAGGFITATTFVAYLRPDLILVCLILLVFIGVNLFQSGYTRFCLMEKLLKRFGFRSELDEIRSMALHDALTGLPNRLLLEDRTDMALAHARRQGGKVAMLFIDIDNFKHVNDLHGHKAGDQLLVLIGSMLRARLRESDTLARWGGDEFVVLLPDPGDYSGARAVAGKLMTAVQQRLRVDHMDNSVTLSVGIALYPDDADSCETLLVQADKALFFAKSQGRNNIQVFSDMRDRGLGYGDFDLTSRFSAAVKEKQIQVHYQPVVDAGTGRPTAVEALARWHDPKYGWVAPGVFIPMAENLGLIHEVGRQVLEQALTHFATSPFKDSLCLAINISNRQLQSRTFVDEIKGMVDSHGLPPSKLKLEITESIAFGIGDAQGCLRELHNAGFLISLDDFGTGFSSLSRLHEVTVQELKIDISFVRRIHIPQGRMMIKTITEMAHAMKLNVVAEGVEDRETAELLRDMGVENLQGYYFGRPVSCEECVRVMGENCGSESVPTETLAAAR